MDSDWTHTRLSELGTFDRGKSKHRPRDAAHLYDGPYPFIQTGDVTAAGGRITSFRQSYSEAGLAQSKLWPAGTLAITIAANIAETALLTFPACFPDSVVGFTAGEGRSDVRFIEYLFRAMRERVRARAYGSVQENINLEVLRNLEFPVPPLRLQQAIANFLSLFDDRIAVLRKTSDTLEAIAQALFKSWFVDFDPVRAKQRGIAPVGMDETTVALFPDSFEESALGLIPSGWRCTILADAFDINPSRILKKGTLSPYLEMASVPTSGHCVEPPVLREFGSGTKFRNGDTLLARITPCLENGKTAFVDFLDGDSVGWGSTEFIVMRPKEPLPAYLAYLLCRHPPFREHARQSMSGTSGRQRVQNDVLGRYLLVVPSDEISAAFEELVGPVQRSIASNHERVQTLATLRDTLLPRLISGQLRLPEAEAALAET